MGFFFWFRAQKEGLTQRRKDAKAEDARLLGLERGPWTAMSAIVFLLSAALCVFAPLREIRPAKGDVDVKHLLHYSLTKDGSMVKAEPVSRLGV